MRIIVGIAALGLAVAALVHPRAAAGDKPGRLDALKDKVVDATVRKGRDLLSKLKDAAPVIRQAGFAMAYVHIEIDLVPAVSVELVRQKKVDDGVMKALLEEHKENKTLVTVLRGLSAANKLDVLGYRMEKVTVTIPPRTTITLAPVE